MRNRNTLGDYDWLTALIQAGSDVYGTIQDGKFYEMTLEQQMEQQANALAMQQARSQQLKTITNAVGIVAVAAIAGVIIYKIAS